MSFVSVTLQVPTASQITTIQQEWLSVGMVNECRNWCVYPVPTEHNDRNSNDSNSDGLLLGPSASKRGSTGTTRHEKYQYICSCPQDNIMGMKLRTFCMVSVTVVLGAGRFCLVISIQLIVLFYCITPVYSCILSWVVAVQSDNSDILIICFSLLTCSCALHITRSTQQ